MRFVLLVVVGVVLLGCGRSVHIDNSTPDLALKSWWRLQDAEDQFGYQQCTTAASGKEPLVAYQKEILSGEVANFFLSGAACLNTVFERKIDEVKMESDSRAWIIATIKNVTPLPGDVHLVDFERKERESGDKFRYLLERDGDGQPWKLSQVFRTFGDADSNPDWRPLYDPKNKPAINYSLVH